jgi:hypothetical protein
MSIKCVAPGFDSVTSESNVNLQNVSRSGPHGGEYEGNCFRMLRRVV